VRDERLGLRIGRVTVLFVSLLHILFAGKVSLQPLSSEYGTYETVTARFWPWLSGQTALKHLKLFPEAVERVSFLLAAFVTCETMVNVDGAGRHPNAQPPHPRRRLRLPPTPARKLPGKVEVGR